jgi:hypothetical protein
VSQETSAHERLHLLIHDLPYAGEQSSDGSMVGLLVPADPGLVRLVAGATAFSFLETDVLNVAPLDETDALAIGLCAVRLMLRAPATVVKIEMWAEFQHVAAGTRRPFAYATRPHPIAAPPRDEFRERELQFCRMFE